MKNELLESSKKMPVNERFLRRELEIMAKVFRGAADGRGSSGPKRRRWCLQKEIAASAIRRGRAKYHVGFALMTA